MSRARSDPTVELVARAIYEAERHAHPWDRGSAKSKERSREYARNAIKLLDDDIGVLLFALNAATAEHSLQGSGAMI